LPAVQTIYIARIRSTVGQAARFQLDYTANNRRPAKAAKMILKVFRMDIRLYACCSAAMH